MFINLQKNMIIFPRQKKSNLCGTNGIFSFRIKYLCTSVKDLCFVLVVANEGKLALDVLVDAFVDGTLRLGVVTDQGARGHVTETPKVLLGFLDRSSVGIQLKLRH